MTFTFPARAKVGVIRCVFVAILAVGFSRASLVLSIIQTAKKAHMIRVHAPGIEAEVVDRHFFRDWPVLLLPRMTVRQHLAPVWPHAGPISIRIAVQEPLPAPGIAIQVPLLSIHAAFLVLVRMRDGV